MTNPCRIQVLLLLALIVSISGCRHERPTEIRIGGGTTPVFALSGSGDLSSFSIYLIPPNAKMERPIFEETPVWSFVAQPDWLHGEKVEKIRNVTYGAVPSGYKQGHPTDGVPQAIIQNRVYFVDCETTNAPIATSFFEVKDGKAVAISFKLPCLEVKGGKWVNVPCKEHP